MAGLNFDPYVIDALLPDLVGHDRRPAAFLVYLYLLRHARTKGGRRETRASLQTIATGTGLSKSAVQQALRHLKRRSLLDPEVIATTSDPIRSLMDPRAR